VRRSAAVVSGGRASCHAGTTPRRSAGGGRDEHEPLPHNRGVSIFHEGNRRLQDRFDTRRLADRIEERFLARTTIDDSDRAFIESCDMLFIATADVQGRPQCSYKGGEPGFVRVLDERTVAFPNYDGNGMYLTAGNALVNPQVGLLFLSFEQRKRLRLNGTASHTDDEPLLAEYPEAQFLWRVEATEVFPNCPRYIHHYRVVERSRFVPKSGRDTPVPAWKTREWANDVLAAGDPAHEPGRAVLDR
jgi:predicted pyridoxine 5'-phosphate oxidase superfamily flavin-nucleotide-binding protein